MKFPNKGPHEVINIGSILLENVNCSNDTESVRGHSNKILSRGQQHYPHSPKRYGGHADRGPSGPPHYSGHYHHRSGGRCDDPYGAPGSEDDDCPPDDPYRNGSDSSSSSEFGRWCRHQQHPQHFDQFEQSMTAMNTNWFSSDSCTFSTIYKWST